MDTKKKKRGFILLAILYIFISTNKVNAFTDYNGGAGVGGGGAGTCEDSTVPTAYCTWDNEHFAAVRLSLVYKPKNGELELVSKRPYYIINEKHPEGIDHVYYLRKSAGYNQVMVTNEITTCRSAGVSPYKSNCEYNIDFLKQMYSYENKNTQAVKKNLANLFTAMGVNLDKDLGRDHNGTASLNSYGYRILVEPLWNFAVPKNWGSGERFFTIKEVYRTNEKTDSGKEYRETQSWLLHTLWDDIGISAPSGKTSNVGDIGNQNTGWGYNIIIPHEVGLKQCYKLNITGTNPVCKYTNKQNLGNYSEVFQSADCETEKDKIVGNATANGRLVKTVNNDCKIYCIENVEVKYPGNVLPAVQKGGYFVWPTFGNKLENGHNLNIKGTRTCKAVGTSCDGQTVSANDLYNDFRSSISVEFIQENYNSTIALAKAKEQTECENCKNIVSSKDIVVTHNVDLKLPENTYRYVNKQTTIATSKMTGSASKYTDIGFGNLPISNSAKVGSNYNLVFRNIDLGAKSGTKGVFSDIANTGANAPYTCTYEAKNTASSCICPTGTTNAGKDLYCVLADSDDLNCPTAQKQYCNTEYKYKDDDCKSKYCPNKPEISLDACVSAGNTYDSCVERLCNGKDNPPKYECPKNTPNEFMDISPCVESQMAKGKTEKDAIAYCQDVVCPMTGIPIIYRTISLKNPFPSKDLDGKVSGFNEDTENGRYPGANWNSKILVNAEIRNNRNVKDEEVYNKEPLYKFVIDAKNIRAIRTYNRAQATGKGAGYSDFTLECKGEVVNANGEKIKDGSKCYSKVFLRDETLSGLVGGVCTSTDAKNFDSCVEE